MRMSARDVEADPEWIVTWMILVVVFHVIAAVCVLSIYRGRNWARIAWLVLFGLSIVGWRVPSEDGDAANNLEQGLSMLALLLECLAMVLLCTRPGAMWFAPRE